jgi:hypothetical protein
MEKLEMDDLGKQRIRNAWQALQVWQGPWDPVNYGDMAVQINGMTLDVKVRRWIEDDGTGMAAAIVNGLEVERKIVGSTMPN